MANHLLIVEGAHDAAFFGRLLAARGFQEAKTKGQVPDFWQPTIPNQFPLRPNGQLDRVMPFPEIHVHAGRGDVVGIEVAEGDGAVLRALRSFLDQFQTSDFASLSLVLDTDLDFTEAQRFAAFRALTDPWNAKGVADDRPGFPLAFPEIQNTVVAGPPRLGVYLLPGEGAQGSLETILLECAQALHPELHRRAAALVAATDQGYPTDVNPDPLRALRRGSGRAKAQCGVIGNVFKPGASLAVSLRETAWLPAVEADIPALAQAAAFLDTLLGAEA